MHRQPPLEQLGQCLLDRLDAGAGCAAAEVRADVLLARRVERPPLVVEEVEANLLAVHGGATWHSREAPGGARRGRAPGATSPCPRGS